MPAATRSSRRRTACSAGELRHRDQHTLAGGEAQCGRAVVRQPDVTVAPVGERHPQAGDGHPAERVRGVEDRTDLHAAEPEPGVGADDARSHHDDGGVGVRDVARHRERGEDRDRLVVAAEGVPARDGGVDEPRRAERGDEVGQRQRQPGAVGHHVREARVGPRGA